MKKIDIKNPEAEVELIRCPVCKGSGLTADNKARCSTCDGKGKIVG